MAAADDEITGRAKDVMPDKYVVFPPVGGAPRPIPRACSDVFRFWGAIGLGLVLTILFYGGQAAVEAMGLRRQLTPAQLALEEDFGANLVAWVGFAVAYLWLGIRAFRGVDNAELVRRIKGTPLPRTAWQRWFLAGGGGIVFPVIIAVWAFSTVVTAVINRKDVPVLVLTMSGLTVLSCIAVITFSFALFYARRDVEAGGIDFSGPDEPVFSDYVYLASGCSVTFGTTDTTITSSSMRRWVTFHSALAWILNTVVIATMVSLAIN